jgi:hypothetical protein
MSGFKWNEKNGAAAIWLSQGYTHKEVAAKIEVTTRTIERWVADADFSAEVDRLSLMVGIASRAERLRLAMRVVRQKTEEQIDTDKDLLDWLKFAQGETDGIKLDLTSISEAASSVAESRSDREADQRSKAPGKPAGRKKKG